MLKFQGCDSSQRSFPDGIVQNPGYPAGFVAGIAWDFVPFFLAIGLLVLGGSS